MSATRAIAAMLLTAVACVANAQPVLPSAAIAIENASTGSIQLKLTWLSNGACGPLISRTDPVITVSGSNIQIVSTNEFFDCSPPQVPIIPTSASIVADLGMLADGTYSVVWSFQTAYPHAALAPVTASLKVANAFASPVQIPTMAMVGALVLVSTLAFVGWRSL